LVASHAALPAKGPRPYTAAVRESNWACTARAGAKARDLFAATRVCQARIGVPDFVTSYLNSSADWNSKLQMAGATREIAS